MSKQKEMPDWAWEELMKCIMAIKEVYTNPVKYLDESEEAKNSS